MELPKNITQVGETDKNCKIYVEDYVVSYIRQMNKFAEEKEIAIAVFGKMAMEQQITYCFVYGACVVQSISREVRHLSQAQNQEIERARKKYFPEQTFLGYQILNSEMVEGFWICDQSSCRYVKGYACFFEKNDTMLAYMLEVRAEQVQPEKIEQDKYDEVRRRQEERKMQFEGRQCECIREDLRKDEGNQRKFKAGPFILTAVACLAIMTYFRNDSFRADMSERLWVWVEDIITPKLDDIVTGDDLKRPVILDEQAEKQELQAVMGTLLTEDKLADAVLEENENALEDEVVTEMIPQPEENAETKTTETETLVEPEQAQTEPEGQTENKEEVQPVVQKPESYVIQPGDTLIAISNRIYGNENAVTQICAVNNISNPDNIQIGQKILLP